MTSTGLAGHTGPLLPFLDVFAARGDRVRVLVPATGVEQLGRRRGCEVIVCPPPDPDRAADIWAAVPTMTPAEVAEAPCLDRRPDLTLREPCAYAGAVVAQRLGTGMRRSPSRWPRSSIPRPASPCRRWPAAAPAVTDLVEAWRAGRG